MNKTLAFSVSSVVFSLLLLHAQSAFRFERTILPAGPGPNRLRIDVPLLAGARPFRSLTGLTAADGPSITAASEGLDDLRIRDASGREIPYIMVAPSLPTPEWVKSRTLAVAATEKTSGFEADLDKPYFVDSLRIEGLPAPFLKRLRLEGSGDRSRWSVLIDEGTLFDLPSERHSQLELEFAPGTFRYLRVTWDDSASARVPMPAAVIARRVSTATPAPPLRATVPFERRPGEPGVSRYRVQLPAPRLPIVAIEIASSGRNVLRRARVSESRMSGPEMVPQLLGVATLWHTAAGPQSGAELSIPITPPQESSIELAIEDGDNPPLEFTTVTAVFARLPWIYFESPGTEPLTAWYGRPDLGAPSYDLEAARRTVAGTNPPEAAWGEERTVAERIEAPANAAPPSRGAAVDIASFRFRRPILPAEPGLNAVAIDADVLAHSDLGDVRIVDPDGFQVPYLVEKLDEALTLELPAPRSVPLPAGGADRLGPGAHSVYELRLPYPHLPAPRLVLTTAARVFQRRVRVFIEKNPADARSEPWTDEIASSPWNHADPDSAAQRLTLRLPVLDATVVRLVVDEGDNSPLPIKSALLLLPAYRLRFFRRDAAELQLCYGNPDLGAPRYDLNLIAPELLGAAVKEVALGPGGSGESAPDRGELLSMKLFWGILILAVIFLLILIVRLVRRTEAR